MKNLLNLLIEYVNRRTIINTILIVLLISASSCKPKHVTETINSVDSLMNIVTDCEQVLVENNIDTLDFFNKYIKHDTDIFRKHLNKMPENEEMVKIFGNYTTLGKVFKRMKSTSIELKKDILISKEQLTNLKHDLSKNLLSNKDTISNYLLSEKEAVENIQNVTNTLVDRLHTNMDYFYEINPKVDEFKELVKDQVEGKEFSKLPGN